MMAIFDLFKTTADQWFKEAQAAYRDGQSQMVMANDRDVDQMRRGVESREREVVGARIQSRIKHCLDKAIKLDPHYAPAWLAMGEILAASDKRHDAVICFEKAVAGCPSLTEADYCLARELEQEKKYDDALVYYEEAIALHPDDAEAWRGKSRLLKRLGRTEEAGACDQQAQSRRSHSLHSGLFHMEFPRWIELKV